MKALAALGALLGLSACAVAPAVNYRLLSERPRRDDWVPYQLTDTTLVLGAGSPVGAVEGAAGVKPVDLAPVSLSCTADGCGGRGVAAVAAPTPFEGETFGIEPRRSHFVRTILTPTYYPASLRLKSLAVEAKDQRKEIIDTVGALAVGVAQLARPPGSRAGSRGARELVLPVIVDLADAKSAQADWKPLPSNDTWSYRVQFLDDPAAAGFLRRADAHAVHGAIVTSLCRPLRITLRSGPVTLAMGVTVADPDYLISVPFPARGAINFGGLCGADVQSQPATETGSDVLVADFFKQVQSLRTAVSSKGTH